MSVTEASVELAMEARVREAGTKVGAHVGRQACEAGGMEECMPLGRSATLEGFVAVRWTRHVGPVKWGGSAKTGATPLLPIPVYIAGGRSLVFSPYIPAVS